MVLFGWHHIIGISITLLDLFGLHLTYRYLYRMMSKTRMMFRIGYRMRVRIHYNYYTENELTLDLRVNACAFTLSRED